MLVVEGSVDIQGLVAVASNKDMGAVYIDWMCASPDNIVCLTDNVRYTGIGGHLFAIAVQKSVDFGYDGLIYGFEWPLALCKGERNSTIRFVRTREKQIYN